MTTLFVDDSHVHTRALQIYQVLLGLAWNRQTITYGYLSREPMEGYGSGGILNRPLGCIMGWCYENGLEPLTVLVVNDETGVPGVGLITVPDGNWPAAQQRVFDFNWFSIMPPTLVELRESGERAQNETLLPPRQRG
jgi:putative restriction endonuclease